MSRQPTTALAALETPHGRVLVRKVFEKRQRTFILVLAGPPGALGCIVPGRVHHEQRRLQVSPEQPCRSQAALMVWFHACLLGWQAAAAGSPRGESWTLGDCVAHERERLTGTVRASSLATYAAGWRALDRLFGDSCLVADLTRERVQGLVATLARQGWSGRSIRNLLGTLQRVLHHAVLARVLAENPAVGLTKPAVAPVRGCLMTPEQRQLTLDAAATLSPSVHLAVGLGLLAGLRPGEVGRIRWEDVLIGRRVVLVRSRPDGMTKSGRERSVPMCHGLREILVRYQQRSGVVVDAVAQAAALGRCWRLGTSLRHVGEAAGMPWLRPHDLRRAFASAAATSGVSALVLQHWLGHHSITETQRYVTIPEGYHEAVEGVDAPEVKADRAVSA